MKSAAAFITLAFFMFLNSGMFVCAVHCGTAGLVAKPKIQMACTSPCCKHSTNSSKGNDCSKKHGEFRIKENIQPGYSIRLHMPLLTLLHSPVFQFNVFRVNKQSIARLPVGKAPPDIPGTSFIIRYHKLLI